jgi:6-phosphogluconate dehydrogenase (decarboxylating)
MSSSDQSGTGNATGRTVAVIGLGIMGGPMAANLVKAGYEVVGYNRSRAKIDALVAKGGRAARAGWPRPLPTRMSC